MAKKIKINTARLATDADQIQTCITNMTTEIQNMTDTVTQLETMWSGPGCKAFHKAFYDDIKAVKTIIDNLKKILDYDREAKQQYERCERKVSGMIEDIIV